MKAHLSFFFFFLLDANSGTPRIILITVIVFSCMCGHYLDLFILLASETVSRTQLGMYFPEKHINMLQKNRYRHSKSLNLFVYTHSPNVTRTQSIQ